MKVFVILGLGFGDDEDGEDIQSVRSSFTNEELDKMNKEADAEYGARLDGRKHFRVEEHDVLTTD